MAKGPRRLSGVTEAGCDERGRPRRVRSPGRLRATSMFGGKVPLPTAVDSRQVLHRRGEPHRSHEVTAADEAVSPRAWDGGPPHRPSKSIGAAIEASRTRPAPHQPHARRVSRRGDRFELRQGRESAPSAPASSWLAAHDDGATPSHRRIRQRARNSGRRTSPASARDKVASFRSFLRAKEFTLDPHPAPMVEMQGRDPTWAEHRAARPPRPHEPS
jgi:hypothetical protein